MDTKMSGPIWRAECVGPQRAAATGKEATSAMIHAGPGAESLIELPVRQRRQQFGRTC